MTDTIYRFAIQSFSTYKGLFFWLNWLGYVSNVFIRPFVMVVMFSVLGRFAGSPESAQVYGLGIATYSMSYVLLGGITQTYSYERMLGTISFFYASPANRLVNFLSRPVCHYPNALLSFLSGLIATWLVVNLEFRSVSWAGFIISTLVTAGSIAAFGQFVGVFALAFRDWMNVFSLANGILLACTGVIIPITAFPDIVQEFVRLLPMTNGLLAIRAAFSGAHFSIVLNDILRELLTGIGYMSFGYVCFCLFEYRARMTGSMERDDF